MDPRTGMTVELQGAEGDPPALGSRLDVEAALEQDLVAKIDQLEEAEKARLAQMAERREPLVAVDADVVQKLRLGERELRRRRQRR